MGIAGWIHHHDRDLRDERATLNALARAVTVAPRSAGAVHVTRRAGFAHHGPSTGYATGEPWSGRNPIRLCCSTRR